MAPSPVLIPQPHWGRPALKPGPSLEATLIGHEVMTLPTGQIAVGGRLVPEGGARCPFCSPCQSLEALLQKCQPPFPQEVFLSPASLIANPVPEAGQ